MLPVLSLEEVGEAIDSAKSGGSPCYTNLFVVPAKLSQWIAHAELFLEQLGQTTLFFRSDRGFWHLYFCAPDENLLVDSIASSPVVRTTAVVVDLVGHDQDVARTAARLASAGLQRHKQLFRMARVVPGALRARAVDEVGDDGVEYAKDTDCQSILDLLESYFDSRAEQLPTPYEIQGAVNARQILVVRGSAGLAGLIYFETLGLTSTLRYWLVTRGSRDGGFGSRLIRRYFNVHPGVRRFVLWVVADNTEVVSKYTRYGFVRDGLIDVVLSNGITGS